MPLPRSFRLLLTTLAALTGAFALGCGGSDGDDDKLTVYSGRNAKLVGDLFRQFERDTGIDVEVRYGESAELAATIGEEGDNSPADLFFSQDAGALGALEREKLLTRLPAGALGVVPARFRDPSGTWVGTSGRARVVAYSTTRIKPAQLPDSIFAFTRPEWKGRIGFAPPNASFQAFVSAMRIEVGDARTRRWLEQIKDNDPVLLDNNIQTEEAIARGEIDVGFVNHYYVYELRAEQPGFPVANHFLKAGDPGSLVNVAGVGILSSADHEESAQRFVEYALSRAGQRYFATKTFEYPLVAGTSAPKGLRPLSSVHGPDIDLDSLGAKLPSTTELLSDVGLQP
jgi:iron(III) transport system substrate-binding protein